MHKYICKILKNSMQKSPFFQAVKLVVPLKDCYDYYENLNLVGESLIKNGYPLTLLNEKIANRYKYLMINKYHNKKSDETIESKDLKKIITLPYINNFQEQFYRIFTNSSLKIIFTYHNTIQQKILTSVKTPTPKKFKYNIVYEVKCIQCNSLYFGQTC